MISATDLILNPNGSVYHLGLLPENIGEIILSVGDPDRVGMVSGFFDNVDFKLARREFATHSGWLGGKRISVISSGIGVDNVEILMTELDALANINLETRTVHTAHKSLKIIRLGTSGSINPNIEIGMIGVSKTAVGFDPLLDFYALTQSEEESEICQKIQKEGQFSFLPYRTRASENLLEVFSELPTLNTLTCNGFYAPQGRQLRLKPKQSGYLDLIASKFDNIEMETAGYYAFGAMFGHEVLSVNAILANRLTGNFHLNPEGVVRQMIENVIVRLS